MPYISVTGVKILVAASSAESSSLTLVHDGYVLRGARKVEYLLPASLIVQSEVHIEHQ